MSEGCSCTFPVVSQHTNLPADCKEATKQKTTNKPTSPSNPIVNTGTLGIKSVRYQIHLSPSSLAAVLA